MVLMVFQIGEIQRSSNALVIRRHGSQRFKSYTYRSASTGPLSGQGLLFNSWILFQRVIPTSRSGGGNLNGLLKR